MRQINQAGLNLLKSFEGLRDGNKATPNTFDPYLDPVGIWTIGYGHAMSLSGNFLRGEKDRSSATSLFPDGLTMVEVEQLLQKDLARFRIAVESHIKVPLTDNQFSALVSFSFNVGIGGFTSSTLSRLLNGGNYEAASRQFARWNKAGGKVLNGLTRRREAERRLFCMV